MLIDKLFLSNEQISKTFRLGSWHIDPRSRRMTDGGRIRKLTPKAMNVLLKLVDAKGKIVTRTTLMDSIWSGVTVGDEALTHVVSELRRAFDDRRDRTKFIETVYKSGYRLKMEAKADESHGDETFSLDAYLLCLEARRLKECNDVGSAEKSVDLCCKAVTLAPRFAFAQANLAISIVDRCLCNCESFPGLTVALKAATVARDLRPDQAFAHAALGLAFSALQEHKKAKNAFIEALGRNPQDFETHCLFARALFIAGDMMTSAIIAEQAARLRCDEYNVLTLATEAFQRLGDQAQSRSMAIQGLERVRRRLAVDPTNQRALATLRSFLARLEQLDDKWAYNSTSNPVMVADPCRR